MKKKVIQISPSELFKTFENESIGDSFIASDNLTALISDRKINSDILHFPFQANEIIMAVCIEGSLKVKLETGNFVLEKNGAWVVLPQRIFEIQEYTPDFKPIVFIMKQSFWNQNDSFLEVVKLQQYFFKENGIKLTEDMMNETITIYGLIKNKIEKKMPFSRQIIQQYINVLSYNVYALLQQQMQKTMDKQPTKEYVFEQFIRLVERYYRQQHGIEFYADRLHLTGKYLSALIRSASGKTAAEWIREYLIMEAKTLLKSGKMSIQQVSNELNFYDQSHFGVFFKKYVGCSPRAYQKCN
ncbi:MAG: AraC family transcriptional regulator [Prevotellaceae bacterium]|jgi:AraC-like DNA-binding protein|nr:AraC family transcriptional regulator [Prevotellaceae bacterium]